MITNISIKNFKSLKSANIDLKNLTVFTGINGVGKSSFIQTLLLLRQSQLDNTLPKRLILNHEKYVQLGQSKDVFNIYAEDSEYLSISLMTDGVGEICINASKLYGKTWLDIEGNYIPNDWSTVAKFVLFSNENNNKNENNSFHLSILNQYIPRVIVNDNELSSLLNEIISPLCVL